MKTLSHKSHVRSEPTEAPETKVSSAHRRAALASVPLVQELSNAAVVGLQVRAHRKKQGLRIDDAAALTGVSVDLMSRLENGAASVRLDKLMAVLNGLGLTLLMVPKGHEMLKYLPADKVLDGPTLSSEKAPSAGDAA